MKSLTLAMLLGIPLMASAQMRPGTHGQVAPAPEPMKRFAWRDEAAGYTFVAPPRWAGKVRAVPLDSKALAKSGATSGVRFVAGSKTLLVLVAADEVRANALMTTGNRELSRHDGHVVAVKAEKDGGELALTDAELASAVQWDGAGSGTAVR
jgi:hypothetical protein